MAELAQSLQVAFAGVAEAAVVAAYLEAAVIV